MAPVAHAGGVDARTVLLADDDEDFRVSLAEALDDDGYDASRSPVRQQLDDRRATAPKRAPAPRP